MGCYSAEFSHQTLNVPAWHSNGQTGDFLFVENHDGTLYATLGDMADTHTGLMHVDGVTAAALDLPPETEFNASVIGRVALEKGLRGTTEDGEAFLARANRILAATHQRLGLLGAGDLDSVDGPDPASVDAANRCTGFAARVALGPKSTTITVVGDISVWVNGISLWEPALPLSGMVSGLVDALADPATRDSAYQRFANKIELPGSFDVMRSLRAEIAKLAELPGFNRQTAHLAVAGMVMPWYVRQLQNNPEHHLGWGVVDGTTTPTKFVRNATVDTADILNLVIASDGSKPFRSDGEVHRMGDLVASNPKYGDRAVVHLSRADLF